MRLHRPNADFFIPDDCSEDEALGRITHLGIGAHQDDLEFMAFHGISHCFRHDENRWFGGVVCTNGAGSSRVGPYAGMADDALIEIRRAEQRAAAIVGHYSAILQLDHPSATVKSPTDVQLAEDLFNILAAALPQVVYTHNLADKHDTHLAVTAAVLQAIRALPEVSRPQQLLGCEVWRGLDWLNDDEKVGLDVSGYDHLAAGLNGIFDSQIGGGKRYDLATIGRRAANATYFDAHTPDNASQVCLAMDLTPLIRQDELDPVEFALAAIDRFREDVRRRLQAAFAG